MSAPGKGRRAVKPPPSLCRWAGAKVGARVRGSGRASMEAIAAPAFVGAVAIATTGNAVATARFPGAVAARDMNTGARSMLATIAQREKRMRAVGRENLAKTRPV